jgi:beta-lactamase class A
MLLFVPLVLLLAGLIFFLASTADDPVTRAQTPTAGPTLQPPDSSGEEVARSGGRSDPRDATQSVAQASISAAEKGDLRQELERISAAYPGRYGVIVFDPSTGQTVSMDPDGRFLAASINKLPVLMTLYRSAAAGTVDLDAEISMQASDVQAYGTGSLYTKPIGYTMTLRECAAFLIKQSDNTAWKMLDRYLGRDYIRSELQRVGATTTEYWIPNTTTPNEILIMLEKIADPSYTSPELSAEMLDLMKDTDFEDRLPQLLPEGAEVSHKIGSYGATFGDAGLVFPKGSRQPEDAYFIVVMVDETGEGTARAAMQEMSLASYRTYVESGP